VKAALQLGAFALGVRVLAWSGTCTIGSDSFIYLDMAGRILDGQIADALRWAAHPAYPFLIAGLGGGEFAGFLVAVVLGAAATLPLYLLVRDAVGEREAVVAAVMYSVMPGLVEISSDIMTEGPFFCFFLFALWTGWRALDGHAGWALASGAFSGFAYLTRNEGLLAPAAVGSWLVVEAIRRKTWKPLLNVAALSLAWFVVALPYLLWIHRELGRWALSLKGSGRVATAMASGEARVAAGALYVRFLECIWRGTAGVVLPFVVWGLCRSFKSRGRIYLATIGLAYLGAILYALPYVGYVGYRYVLGAICVLLGAASIAWVELADRFKEPVGRWALVAFAVVMGCWGAMPHRWSEQSFIEAGRWIAAQKPKASIIASTDKIIWYAGGEITYRRHWESFPPTQTEFAENAPKADFIVLTSRDTEKKHFAWIGDLDGFEKVGEDFTRGRRKQVEVFIFRRRR